MPIQRIPSTEWRNFQPERISTRQSGNLFLMGTPSETNSTNDTSPVIAAFSTRDESAIPYTRFPSSSIVNGELVVYYIGSSLSSTIENRRAMTRKLLLWWLPVDMGSKMRYSRRLLLLARWGWYDGQSRMHWKMVFGNGMACINPLRPGTPLGVPVQERVCDSI